MEDGKNQIKLLLKNSFGDGELDAAAVVKESLKVQIEAFPQRGTR